MKKIALINHGCAKNLVDSELMLGLLAEKGYEITLDDTNADVVIVNTCSFIHDAEKESVQSILQMTESGKKVIVTGCLPQKHKEDLKKAIPEVCAMVGTTDFKDIVPIVERVLDEQNEEYVSKISEKPEYIYPESIHRQQITMGSSSYIKIADGCNYHCGYCIIPQLRGQYRSRTIEHIVDEANELVKKGVTEIDLIAQDTTSYGIDIYGKPSLAKLLTELNKIEGLGWLRVMYAYPTQMTDELLETMEKLDKVAKYVDIPLQHFSKSVLEAMRRPVSDYDELVKNIREKIPNVAIRTAFIVGYPGETEEDFLALYDFVKRSRFDKMGVFEYSREKNTTSYSMKNQVPKRVAHERFKKLMELQQQISYEINQTRIGKILPCIVESITDDGLAVMRSEYDAPEIDGMVYAEIHDKNVIPGDIERVKITKADEYDLWGEIV